jgi:hypothetical protein
MGERRRQTARRFNAAQRAPFLHGEDAENAEKGEIGGNGKRLSLQPRRAGAENVEGGEVNGLPESLSAWVPERAGAKTGSK